MPYLENEPVEYPCSRCGGEQDAEAIMSGADMCTPCVRDTYEEDLQSDRDLLRTKLNRLRRRSVQLSSKADADLLGRIAKELGLSKPKAVHAALSYLKDHTDEYRKSRTLRALARELFKPVPGALKLLKCSVGPGGTYGDVVVKRREKLTIHEHLHMDGVADTLSCEAATMDIDLDVEFEPPLGDPDYPLDKGLTSSMVSERVVKVVNRYMKKIGVDRWGVQVFWKGDYEEDGIWPEVVVKTPSASKELEGELSRVLVDRSQAIGWDIASVLVTYDFMGNGDARVYSVPK